MDSQNIIWDVIIPIGDACRTTIILQKAKLRKKAFPLDWVVSFAKTTYLDLTTNFSYLLKKDKKQYSHYQQFEKEEINVILQNRINRLHQYLNSNLNIIFFYTTWSRIATRQTNLINKEDKEYLFKIYNYINQLQFIKNKKFIITNINNTLEDIREVKDIDLIDINLQDINFDLNIDKTSLYQVNQYKNNLPKVETFITDVSVEKLLKLNLQFTNFSDGIQDPNPYIFTKHW